MAALTSASVRSTSILLCLSVVVASDVITARLGETVTLPCSAQKTSTIIVVHLKRPNLETEHVFVYRDGRSDPGNQHPSYINRVELKDKEMKNGDASVTLKNVTGNDTGTYECRVGNGSRPQPISNITLTVTESGGGAGHTEEGGDKDGGDKHGGNNGGHVGLTVGVTVLVLLVVVVVVVGFVIYRKLKGRK